MTSSGARLIMTRGIEGFSGGVNTLGQDCGYGLCDGVTAGDAVRFDMLPKLADGTTDNPSYQKYVRAQADSAANAEVIGVIEDIDDGVVSVVLSGQIIMPSSRFTEATHIDPSSGTTGSDGGHDVYFLSEATAGYIQNLAPNTATQIAKPILQRADDGDFNAHVVNYIGYQIGGQVVASTDDEEENFTMRNISIPEGETIGPMGRGIYNLSIKGQFLPTNTLDLEFPIGGDVFSEAGKNRFSNNPYGARYRLVTKTSAVRSLFENKAVSFRNSTGEKVWIGKCVAVGDQRNPNENVIWVTSVDSNDPPISSGNTTIYGRGNERVEVTSYIKTAVALPYVNPSNAVGNFQDINGKRIATTQITVGKFIPDGGLSAVTIPDKLECTSLTAENIVLENTQYKISDLFTFLRSVSDQVDSTDKEVNGSASTVSNSISYETK